MGGPLSGIRVLEVGHMLAGPFGGMMLADLGADVIKIEPLDGDMSRRVGSQSVDGHNVYFASLNRNKRSVHIDLTTEEGQAQLGELAKTADALLVNLRPSTIKKLGLTYESLRRYNPKLVCVALTGYGLDGPAAEWPAFDYVIQARVGVAALTGEPDGPPTLPGYSAVDNSSGITAALALVAKVLEGKGGQVDVSLFDVLGARLKEAPAMEWEERLRPLGLAVGAVKELADVLDGDLVRERGMVVSIETADGPLRLLASPIRFDDGKTEYNPPPRLHE